MNTERILTYMKARKGQPTLSGPLSLHLGVTCERAEEFLEILTLQGHVRPLTEGEKKVFDVVSGFLPV